MQNNQTEPQYPVVPLKYDEIRVAAAQMSPVHVDPLAPAKGIQANIDRMLYFCDWANTWPPSPQGVQLVVFPEFCINGIDTTWSRKQILNTVISVPGPETEQLGKKAKELNCYICFANYSKDPDWPNHFFNMSVIIGPNGNVIHKHFKAYRGIPGFNEWATTVHDILDEFVERHGWDAVWPVAKTPIGNLASYVCSEGFMPETARMFAMNGAEILMRNTAGNSAQKASEYSNPVIEARADCGVSNLYGIYANSDHGGVKINGKPMAENAQGGSSMIIDCYGNFMSEAEDSREAVIHATIPIASHRKKHKLPQLRRELYAPMYDKKCISMVPANLYSDYLPETRQEAWEWAMKNAIKN